MPSTVIAITAAGDAHTIHAYHQAEGLDTWQELYDHYFALCDGESGAPPAPYAINELISFAWDNDLTA